MRLLTPLVLVLLAATSAAAADVASLSGPVLGYVFDASHGGLRPILGIPGASQFGVVLDLGLRLSAAEVSPRHDYALAVAAGSGDLLLIDLTGTRIAALPVPGVAPGVSRMALSPAGGAALLYYQESAEVRWLSGLPRNPSLGTSVSLTGLGDITALAVADDGAGLAAAGDSLFLLSPADGPRWIASVGRAADLHFLDHSRDALVADSARHEVLLIRDVAGAAQPLLLAGERDGIWEPAAVAAYGSRIFAANAGSQSVAVLDTAGGAVTLLPCTCAPARLSALHGQGVFRLNDPGSRPLFLLDGAGEIPRIVFVPAPDEPLGVPRWRRP